MIKSEKLKQILKSYHERKLAHAFLLETNDEIRCYKDVLELIKELNCPFDYYDDCNLEECNICHLIDNDNLPSLITIKPEGNFIKKDQILDMMGRFKSIPVFTKFNCYVIQNSENFNNSSANTILKFLEEPEDNILGFFITNNKINVISTIRSRCQEIRVDYKEEKTSYYTEDTLLNVIVYLNSIYKNKDDLLYNKTHMFSLYSERKDWQNFFTSMFYYLNDVYKDKVEYSGIKIFNERSKENLVSIILLVEEVLKYIKSNGNIELILDKFVIEMRKFYE